LLGRAIPRPSPAEGRRVAILPPLVAAKLALYAAMRAQRTTRTALAHRLSLQENAARRLLDLDHRAHIDRVARALAMLGKRLDLRSGCWSRRETGKCPLCPELPSALTFDRRHASISAF
jgi:antitoxin HicB